MILNRCDVWCLISYLIYQLSIAINNDDLSSLIKHDINYEQFIDASHDQVWYINIDLAGQLNYDQAWYIMLYQARGYFSCKWASYICVSWCVVVTYNYSNLLSSSVIMAKLKLQTPTNLVAPDTQMLYLVNIARFVSSTLSIPAAAVTTCVSNVNVADRRLLRATSWP